jgi:hypothetical protein
MTAEKRTAQKKRKENPKKTTVTKNRLSNQNLNIAKNPKTRLPRRPPKRRGQS